MISLKFRLGCVPLGIVLTTVAMQSNSPFGVIAPGVASAIVPQQVLARSPLVPLFKENWGDQITQLAQSNPPPRRNPGSSVSGGRRDPVVCPLDASMPRTDSGLIALSPTTKPGTTLAERPSFLVYVPETNARTAEFALRDYQGRGVYRTTLTLTNTSGIVSLSLPAEVPPLEVGELYTWSFAIICDPNRRLDDRFVTGMVQRIEFDPTRVGQIQQTSLRDQVSLYRAADVWYDTLAALFELHRAQPNDSSITTIWDEFLHSGGVSVMLN
jgi:Domain of Unknown Function (DUF928)